MRHKKQHYCSLLVRAKRAIEANLGFIRKPYNEYKGLTIIFIKLDCAPFDPLRRIITTELKTG
jgi:hypothetical protein